MALRTERSFGSLIALLRQTQNSFRPMVRLPPEILGEIFQYACSWCFRCHLAQRWTGLKEVLQSLCKVLHVCCHWRIVAHGVPALWNCLDNSYPLAEHFFLERSRTGDLAVRIRIGESNEDGDFEHFFKSHSLRLRELHMWIGYEEVSPDFCIKPIRLRRLNLSTRFTRSTPSFATMLFTACSSSLEQMQLEGLDGIPHHRFDNLTYLQLVFVRASVPEFLELLSNCPNLTDLQLFHPKIREGSANDDYVLSLPNLRRLRIKIGRSVLAASLISKIPLSTSRRAQFLEFGTPVQFVDLKYQGDGDAEQMPSIM
ncbi:uncharacterized protein LAESUDRAFT_183941 [Laetiporus sulphureus 93-53]|uniref:Uncharacterized protein n=1 Tax=Laetiporus sulphureus 93-53 TaxID=1314785 RepID=A0A165E3Y6_9APHY|nr:uncharacterized protein LAESUDRAFT_183941 [Laetiporus sulphureus 93-53]KZT06202.1 hypothetical protein LAESUDRAFT_183941 [Laetiporus sulphureus 93-53]